MSNTTTQSTTDVLQAFADAWNRHDVDALMSFMTEDCVFEASAGPDDCGTRYAGREAVRAGFAEVWATFPDAHWGGARHFVCGDRGVSEWTFTGTRAGRRDSVSNSRASSPAVSAQGSRTYRVRASAMASAVMSSRMCELPVDRA